MEAIPDEWVDKLFDCMAQFYGERWTRNFTKPHTESMAKLMWKNGLLGLNYEQIKQQLQRCKRHAEDPAAFPLHVLEFYRHAKNSISPPIKYIETVGQKPNPDIAKRYIDDIKYKLR